tara:strand:- start:676 stop:936 length:261 start_codon:yes stop_codon:yes gene_type:complete
MSHRLENKLYKWLLPLQDLDFQVKCFSHVANHPKEVTEWVPVTLEKLDTIMFDKKSCEVMSGNDIQFILIKKKLMAVDLLDTSTDK